MLGALEADLRRGELLVSVRAPRLSRSACWGYHKICRKTGEFAHAIGAFVVDSGAGRLPRGYGSDGFAPNRHRRRPRHHRRRRSRTLRWPRRRRTGEFSRHERSARTPDACRRLAARCGAGRAPMSKVSLTVNGSALTAEVEPRTHLADLLRETHNLTGTHIGCEHGVCGACTLLVDGAPIRSCITFAVACENAERHHHRRPRRGRNRARVEGGVHGSSCAAMRLLHARHDRFSARRRVAHGGA